MPKTPKELVRYAVAEQVESHRLIVALTVRESQNESIEREKRELLSRLVERQLVHLRAWEEAQALVEKLP